MLRKIIGGSLCFAEAGLAPPNTRASYDITSSKDLNGSLKIPASHSVVNSNDQSLYDSYYTTSEDIDGPAASDSSSREHARSDSELSTPSKSPSNYGSKQQSKLARSDLSFDIPQGSPSPNRNKARANDTKYIEETIYCSNCSIAFMPSYTGEREFCSRDCETSLALERRDYASHRLCFEKWNNVDSDDDIDIVSSPCNGSTYCQDGLGLRIQVSWETDSNPQPSAHIPNGPTDAAVSRRTLPKTTTPTARILIVNKNEWQGFSGFGNRKGEDPIFAGRTHINYPTAATNAKRYN